MRLTYIRSCALAVAAVLMLAGCSSHCTCPTPQTPSTTIVTPHD